MVEGEDPLLFFDRVDKATDQLAMPGFSRSVEEVDRQMLRSLKGTTDTPRIFLLVVLALPTSLHTDCSHVTGLVGRSPVSEH